MDLWMLLSLGGAISGLVMGWDTSLMGLAGQMLREAVTDSGETEPLTAEEQSAIPEDAILLDSLDDHFAGDEDDTIYIVADDGQDDDSWRYTARTGVENMVSGEAGDWAWFSSHAASSDPEAGFADGTLTDDVLYVDAGAGDDLIEVRGHVPTEIVTGAGADTVIVTNGAGTTVIHADDGDTVELPEEWYGNVLATAGATVVGGSGQDVVNLKGDAVGALVKGGWGDDSLGSEGSGDLRGNAGNDTLIAHGSDTILRGGSGDDTLISEGANIIHGDSGNDLICLGEDCESYTFWGDDSGMSMASYVDTIANSGNGFADTVTGGQGDDQILFIDGGDVVSGGAGNDTYVAIADDTPSTIQGFHPGTETLTLFDPNGTVISHGSGSPLGELTDDQIDFFLRSDSNYNLDGRVSVDKDVDAETISILLDGEVKVVLTDTTWVTVGYQNGGDDTIYGLDGTPLDESLRANVLVKVYPNISEVIAMS